MSLAKTLVLFRENLVTTPVVELYFPLVRKRIRLPIRMLLPFLSLTCGAGRVGAMVGRGCAGGISRSFSRSWIDRRMMFVATSSLVS